ncbi:DsbA family protein [Photobacterium kishitanii]|uniref:Disulfide bond formation protein DsbA n=1 Tax=Photobacterium kishitanii TaxID=318456 RepID=A0A2T3KLL1_9GAMM|nr:DsbA family protein [Photobacterium kishitanii]PSV00598.1 disulfide bond formation protein DsbA [Photobacterium kishitanii]
MNLNKSVVVVGVLIASALSGCNLSDSKFSDSQKEQIGTIAGDYIVSHPEVLIKASQELRKQQMQAQDNVMKQTSLKFADKLTNDKRTPFVGDVKASVSVVEFFDYQCIFCSKISSKMNELQKANPDVKFVYKETPIFSSQWGTSGYAADVGNWVFATKGSDAYSKYHEGVFNTGKNEGRLQLSDVDAVAQTVGMTKAELAKMPKGSYSDTFGLFGALGLQGTPAVIVMPTDNVKSVDDISVIRGFNPKAVESAIAKLKTELSNRVEAPAIVKAVAVTSAAVPTK